MSLAGQRAMIVPADLLDEASLAAAVASVLAQWGRIDLLVNNGRYTRARRTWTISSTHPSSCCAGSSRRT